MPRWSAGPWSARRRGDRLPAPLFFVVGGISQYLGAALAVDLFDRLPPAAVAWLRVAFSALVLWLWRARGSIRRRPVGPLFSAHVTPNRRRIADTGAQSDVAANRRRIADTGAE